jgi:hypothetical protein
MVIPSPILNGLFGPLWGTVFKDGINDHGYPLSCHLDEEVEHGDLHVRLMHSQRIDESLWLGEHRQPRRAVMKFPELESDRLNLSRTRKLIWACRNVYESDRVFIFFHADNVVLALRRRGLLRAFGKRCRRAVASAAKVKKRHGHP